MIAGIADRKFYIIFRPFDSKSLPKFWKIVFGIISLFTRKWAHCDIFFNAGESVVYLCPTPWQLGVKIYPCSMADFLENLKSTDSTACVEIFSDTVDDCYGVRGFIYCVSVVKAIIGERGWYLSPKTLFKRISKKGKILWAPEHYQSLQ